ASLCAPAPEPYAAFPPNITNPSELACEPQSALYHRRMTAFAIPAGLHPFEPAYRSALRARAAIFWVPLFIAALVLDRNVLVDTPFLILLPLLVGLLPFAAIFVAPDRTYRRLGYAIDGRLLRTVRGWLFHTDTVVPFVRVQ